MPSFKTTLCWDAESHHHFLELQENFLSLTHVDKRRFLRRNGFNLFGYKDFVESALMVLVTYGRITEDIVARDGRFFIDPDNLMKRDVNKIPLLHPRNWKLASEWAKDEFEMYMKI